MSAKNDREAGRDLGEPELAVLGKATRANDLECLHEMLANGLGTPAAARAVQSMAKRHGVDFFDEPVRGHTALTRAIAENQPEAAALLLSWGANPKARAARDATALMWAAARGCAELVERLLPVSDLHAKNINQCDALWLAARSQEPNEAAIRMLLAHGADAQAALPEGACSPLAAAAQADKPECVRALWPASDPEQRGGEDGPMAWQAALAARSWAALDELCFLAKEDAPWRRDAIGLAGLSMLPKTRAQNEARALRLSIERPVAPSEDSAADPGLSPRAPNGRRL